MTEEQTQVGGANGAEEEKARKPLPQYAVDLDAAAAQDRAISLLIASRRCYMDQQADDEGPSPSSDPQQYIDRIVEHCAETPDYMLPDTPLKEAIFRVILSGGNKPTDAEEISEILSEKWAMTAYPRDVSPGVIQRLLDNSETYCVARVSEPEDEGVEVEEEAIEAPAEEPEEEAEEEGEE